METKADIPNLFGLFYRTKQTAIGGILLAEKMTDLIASLNHLCAKNNLSIEEGMVRLMGEIASMIRRMEDIQSLPMKELLRLPPLKLSPSTQHPEKSPDDAREPNV